LFVHAVAVEPVDGMRTTFTPPTPPTAKSLVVVLNGRVRAEGFKLVNNQAVFDEAPGLGDVVSFFYTQK
jgi:hypothetical protein